MGQRPARHAVPDETREREVCGDSIPKFLDEAVTKKVKKNYSESKQCWLVVYLNIDDYGISQKETEAAIVEVKRRYASSFEAICVLWRGQLY